MGHHLEDDIRELVRDFYCRRFSAIAPKIENEQNFHPEALKKWDAALQEAGSYRPKYYVLDERQVDQILSWMNASKLESSPYEFDRLKKESMQELAAIIGKDPAEKFIFYLLFFKEVTNRFLRHDPIVETLRTHESAYRIAIGGKSKQVFDHYSENSTLLSVYSASFANAFGLGDIKVLEKLNLSGARILDVGGGAGGLGCALEKAKISVETYDLMDLPETQVALSGPRSIFFDQIKNRHQFIPGDFFQEKLGNEKFYSEKTGSYNFIFLTWILHDWNDKQNHKILTGVRPLLKADGKLIVIERFKDHGQHLFMDVYEFVMLVLAAGVERTRSEYDLLLTRAGYKHISNLSAENSRDFIVYEKSLK